MRNTEEDSNHKKILKKLQLNGINKLECIKLGTNRLYQMGQSTVGRFQRPVPYLIERSVMSRESWACQSGFSTNQTALSSLL